MIPFAKPGRSDSYDVMGARAARAALDDAQVAYARIEQAYVGYVFGDSTAGQKALYPLGLSGIPIINVNNNCSTGSTALFLARQAVASGAVECALALGFEQMTPGALGTVFEDRPSPLGDFVRALADTEGIDETRPLTAQFFAGAGRQYVREHGIDPRYWGIVGAAYATLAGSALRAGLFAWWYAQEARQSQHAAAALPAAALAGELAAPARYKLLDDEDAVCSRRSRAAAADPVTEGIS
jgi:acetyl-CoA acetyltransferase